jgi:hypothetical protein
LLRAYCPFWRGRRARLMGVFGVDQMAECEGGLCREERIGGCGICRDERGGEGGCGCGLGLAALVRGAGLVIVSLAVLVA